MEPLLRIENLSVSFYTPQGEVEAIRDVSLSLKKGEILAVVGESGSGKSVLCRAVLKLLPQRAKIKAGRIIAGGEDIVNFSEKEMRRLRGRFFSMVFQNPLASLHPTMPVGEQIAEAVRQHQNVNRAQAAQRALQLLRSVGIDDAQRLFALQPHYFSGGMRQRCVLALALAALPQILFADEPTTALDVTMQAQILDLLRQLQREAGLSIIFASHDLGAVARVADRVAVMYAGKIVEIGTAEEIFYDPRHPYTWALLDALPAAAERGKKLRSIPGAMPSMLHPPIGDAFATRNPYALRIDYEEMPPLFRISDTHSAATWLLDPRAPRIEPPIRLRGRDDAWMRK